MLEIDEFDPKRHPKSLVSILSTCQNKIFRLYNISAFCGPNAFPQFEHILWFSHYSNFITLVDVAIAMLELSATPTKL